MITSLPTLTDHIVKYPLYISCSDEPDSYEIRKRLSQTRGLRSFEIFPSLEGYTYSQTRSFPYRGSYKTYPKIHNEIGWPSFVYRDGQFLKGRVGEKEFKFKLPKGYSFGNDGYGPKIFKTNKPNDDLHLKSHMMFCKPSIIRRELLNNAKLRRDLHRIEKQKQIAAKRVEKLFLQSLNNTVVFGLDAARAGNCEAGILGFARRHKINPKIGIPANKLFKFSKSEPIEIQKRVKLSVLSANLRECEVCI